MVQSLTLEVLSDVAADVIGMPLSQLTSEMSAAEIPGWDSLNHTLIVLEISNILSIELGAEETASLPNFGALIALANSRISIGSID